MITALVVIQVTHTHSLNNWKKWKKYIFPPQDHFAGDIANENLKLKDLDEKSIFQM